MEDEAIDTSHDADAGRQLSELVGAVGLYLGELGSGHDGDKERLQRAMYRALRSKAMHDFQERQ
jgi:hypothetical protein